MGSERRIFSGTECVSAVQVITLMFSIMLNAPGRGPTYARRLRVKRRLGLLSFRRRMVSTAVIRLQSYYVLNVNMPIL